MQLPADNPRVHRSNGDWYYGDQQILHPAVARAAPQPPGPDACGHCHLARHDAIHFPELANRWFPISGLVLPTHEYITPRPPAPGPCPAAQDAPADLPDF